MLGILAHFPQEGPLLFSNLLALLLVSIKNKDISAFVSLTKSPGFQMNKIISIKNAVSKFEATSDACRSVKYSSHTRKKRDSDISSS